MGGEGGGTQLTEPAGVSTNRASRGTERERGFRRRGTKGKRVLYGKRDILQGEVKQEGTVEGVGKKGRERKKKGRTDPMDSKVTTQRKK